jgi:NADPH:quinone reductase
MKAVRVEQFGGPDVLRVAEIPAPELRDDEVFIELEAAGVNRLDLLVRSGGYHRGGQPPLVPGVEGSDIIRQVGSAVTGFAAGDRVLAFGARPGSYAEYVAVSGPGPGGRGRTTHRLAVGLVLPPTPRATRSRRTGAHLRRGQRRQRRGGADRQSTSAPRRSPSPAPTTSSPGRSPTVPTTQINRARQDVLAETMALTEGGGVEVVLDAVGGRAFAEALKTAAHGGRVVSMANVALESSRVDTRDLYPKNVAIYGFQVTNLIERGGYDPRGDLEGLADLAAQGHLSVHVDQRFPLEHAAEAHRYLEARRNRGKVILEPNPRTSSVGATDAPSPTQATWEAGNNDVASTAGSGCGRDLP